MSLNICTTLVEWNGQMVSQCNFDYLTNDQTPIVKIGFASVLLTGILAIDYIFAKLIYKKIKFHRNYSKKYERKDVILLIQYIFLLLVFSVLAVGFIMHTFKIFNY